jgi:hypothetical protein
LPVSFFLDSASGWSIIANSANISNAIAVHGRSPPFEIESSMVLFFFVCRFFARRGEKSTDKGYEMRRLRKSYYNKKPRPHLR